MLLVDKMDFPIGTPVLFIPEENDRSGLSKSIGVIVEIEEDSVYPYRINFDDGDDDWYSDDSGFVEEIVENYLEALNENRVK